MDCTICAPESWRGRAFSASRGPTDASAFGQVRRRAPRSRTEGAIMACRAAVVAAWGVGGWSPPAGPQFAGLRGARCVFVLRKPLAGGHPRTPERHSARHKQAVRHGPSSESASGAGRRGCRPRPSCPVVARRCRTARRPASRRTGPPPPRSGARHPSGTDCLSGSDPRGRGRGCANAPGPEPVAGLRTGGSLPALSSRPLRPRPSGKATRKTVARSSFRRPAGAHV